MRIIYSYIFDVTKKVKRDDIIPSILSFLKNEGIEFRNILFNFYWYTEENSKNYFEKLCSRDIFWKNYYIKYNSDIAKDTYIVGVSNVEKNSWEQRDIDKHHNINILLSNIQEQFIKMPKTCSCYKLSFNDVNWSRSYEMNLPIVDSWTTKLYPLSSNITIWNDYRNKIYIVFNFEMRENTKNHLVVDFSNQIDCLWSKEIIFISNNHERVQYQQADLKIHNILNEIDCYIDIDFSENQQKKKANILKVLKKVICNENFQYEKVENDVYLFYKVDQYNNKLEVSFDYEKINCRLCASITYKGYGFKHTISFRDMNAVVCDESIEQYALKIMKKVKIFENKYIPVIVKEYEATPEWIRWESNSI